MDETSIKPVLRVDFDDSKSAYVVNIPQGSNVNETAFAVSVIAKCFVKDKLIKDHKDFIDLITKYCIDPQYEELTDDKTT